MPPLALENWLQDGMVESHIILLMDISELEDQITHKLMLLDIFSNIV